MMRPIIPLIVVALFVAGCNKAPDDATPVPQGKQTVEAKGPDKASVGGTKGITEDQIELGPGIQNAENRAGSKVSGN